MKEETARISSRKQFLVTVVTVYSNTIKRVGQQRQREQEIVLARKF
jgi:hypothetical protein